MAASRPGKNAPILDVYQYGDSLFYAGRFDEWADMFAENGVMEMPLRPRAAKSRFEGREAIRREMKPTQEVSFDLFEMRATDHRFHEAGDTLIHEFVLNIRPRDAVEAYRVPYVHIVLIRDGEYVLFRDYAGLAVMPPAALSALHEKLMSRQQASSRS